MKGGMGATASCYAKGPTERPITFITFQMLVQSLSLLLVNYISWLPRREDISGVARNCDVQTSTASQNMHSSDIFSSKVLESF